MKNNKGFTLIELIMVIVIMGILAAVVVPRFFSLESKAHQKVEASVIGNIKAGILSYSLSKLVDEGVKTFPTGGSLTLAAILDETPSGWSVVSVASTDTIKYTARGDSSVYWIYSCATPYTSYTLGGKVATAK